MNISFFLAGIFLGLAFMTYISKNSVKYKNKPLSFWQKIRLYFKYCPCGGKLEKWSSVRFDCNKCTKKYYI